MGLVNKKKDLIADLETQLLRCVRVAGNISRVELAAQLRCAPSTVGIYVARLIREGYLLEGEKAEGAAGRPRLLLRLNPAYGRFVGLDFEARGIRAMALDFSQKPLRSVRKTIRPADGVEKILALLETAVAETLEGGNHKLLGIGVGVPGLVDPVQGIAREYVLIKGWHQIHLAKRLHKRFGVPVHLENNVRTMALAELWFGQGQRQENFVCLGIRSGIAVGVVLRGQLYDGADFVAGEIGRWPCLGAALPKGRRPRYHGSPKNLTLKSLEELASVGAIIGATEEQIRAGCRSPLAGQAGHLTIPEIIQAARQGDALARRTLESAAQALGWALAQLIALLDPGRIILAGPLTAWGDALVRTIQESLRRFALTPAPKMTVIVNSALGDFSGALGAAALSVQHWRLRR